MTSPAVFVDRDGVLIRAIVRDGKPYPPATVADVEILPGVREATHLLKDAGFHLVVATNQPDVSRGVTSVGQVDAIHAFLAANLPLDAIRTCFHDDGDHCDCRKPQPGLLLDAAQAYSLDLTRSWMVGDRWRDISAGVRAGCRTIFIDYGYDERQPVGCEHRVASLLEAARIILQEQI